MKIPAYLTSATATRRTAGTVSSRRMFALIGTTSATCVEFGGWDGCHRSNTANLWTQDWKGIPIEANHGRHEQLKRNVAGNDCLFICVRARFRGPVAGAAFRTPRWKRIFVRSHLLL